MACGGEQVSENLNLLTMLLEDKDQDIRHNEVLELLAYAAFSYSFMRPQATSVCGLKLLDARGQKAKTSMKRSLSY